MKYMSILMILTLTVATALLTACNQARYPSSGAVYYYDQRQVPMNIIQTPNQN